MIFAYLIMAHDNIEQLKMLIKALDYPENDIYLHIDKKSAISKEQIDVKFAKLNVYKKYVVYWGDISQTKCQLFLLREAIKQYHDYYHLISGHDFPIKKHKDILTFFAKNNGKEFIHFDSQSYSIREGCKYYHPLSSFQLKYRHKWFAFFFNYLDEKLVSFQKKHNVQRKIYSGANWFSITHSLAKEYCTRHKTILRKVWWSFSSDECVLQTFYRTMAAGTYKLYAETKDDSDYNGTAREIDWLRGNPYVWTIKDYDYLMNSKRMFARKFDQRVDGVIIKKIADIINK